MFAAALAMAGALAVVEAAVGEEPGSCSLETAAAPVMVASAANVAATDAAAPPAPATEAAPAATSPAPATELVREEPVSPPGSCGAPERMQGTTLTPVVASTSADEPARPVAAMTPEPETSAHADVSQKTEVALASPPAAKPSPAKASTRSSANKRPSPRAATSDQAALAWWSPKVDDALNLVYAGEASFTPAIVLLFDGAFEDSSLANKVIRVTDDGGTPVSGQWVVATNKRMLLFKASPGHYRVKVGDGLVDSAGRKIAGKQGGPVNVATR
jgi:hypothetical protein